MEVNTLLVEDIRITDQITQYDAACKQLLSDENILAWSMKSCLDEMIQLVINVEAQGKFNTGYPIVKRAIAAG